MSVLAGRNAPLDPAAVEGAIDGHLGDVELELRSGGQDAYWWLLAAE